MSNSESTAINDLIDLVKRKPLDRDSNENLLFEAPRIARLRSAPIPVEMPRARPRSVPAPVSAYDDELYEQDLKTVHVPRHMPLNQTLKKLVLPLAGFLAAGVAIGVVVSLAGRHHEHHVDAPQVLPMAAMPAAPSSVVVAPIEPVVIATPKLVTIHLDSTPPGATATLMDHGTSTALGVTPLDTRVDPSRPYEVVFALEGRITRTEHLDAGTTDHLEIALAAPTVVAPVVAKVPTHHRRHHAAAAKPQAARVAVAATHSASHATGGNGMLMVSTDPPCAILIDGKNTGLTSPQSAISLPVGNHNVRLIAASAHVNKLVAVEITPRHTTKLVQTFAK